MRNGSDGKVTMMVGTDASRYGAVEIGDCSSWKKKVEMSTEGSEDPIGSKKTEA